jgi:hypothetical protein
MEQSSSWETDSQYASRNWSFIIVFTTKLWDLSRQIHSTHSHHDFLMFHLG